MADIYKNVEGITKKQLLMFFLIDQSQSMTGSKIGAVNAAMGEFLKEVGQNGIGNEDVLIKYAVLKFSSGCEWMYKQPISLDERANWANIEAAGVTDMGAAFKELKRKLSINEFLQTPVMSYAPVMFLMSDGFPTDDYESGLATLKENKWFKHGIKAALAIGNEANTDILAEFTGTDEAVLIVHNPEALKKMIRLVSITSSQVGSEGMGEREKSKQEKFNQAIKDHIHDDPDLDQNSDANDDWD